MPKSSGGGGSGGRTNGGGSTNGDAGQPGEVVRAAEQLKIKRVSMANGKVQPGTKAYETLQKQKNSRDYDKRMQEYRRQLEFDRRSKRLGAFGNVRHL